MCIYAFQCNQLGSNLREVVEKYKKYEEASGGLLQWLDTSEREARKQQGEPIAADPQTLQKQLEDTKVTVSIVIHKIDPTVYSQLDKQHSTNIISIITDMS